MTLVFVSQACRRVYAAGQRVGGEENKGELPARRSATIPFGSEREIVDGCGGEFGKGGDLYRHDERRYDFPVDERVRRCGRDQR